MEFAKMILDRMSFSEALFLKELRKLILWSKGENIDELKNWCIDKYGDQYKEKIINTFNTITN